MNWWDESSKKNDVSFARQSDVLYLYLLEEGKYSMMVEALGKIGNLSTIATSYHRNIGMSTNQCAVNLSLRKKLFFPRKGFVCQCTEMASTDSLILNPAVELQTPSIHVPRFITLKLGWPFCKKLTKSTGLSEASGSRSHLGSDVFWSVSFAVQVWHKIRKESSAMCFIQVSTALGFEHVVPVRKGGAAVAAAK